MNPRDARIVLLAWEERLADSDVGVDALDWAEEEVKLTAMPQSEAEWKIALAFAFEAGKFYQRLLDK